MVHIRRKAIGRVASAIGVAAALAIAGLVIFGQRTSTVITTSTIAGGRSNGGSTTTTTESNGTLLASRTWESWSFEVSMNSTSVRTGGAISLSDRLTYLGNANETIYIVSPVSSASVYNSTGAQVWQFTPSQVTTYVTVYPGETFGQPICIPTAVLTPTEQNQTYCFFNFTEQPAPGVYSVVAEPLFYSSNSQDLGQDLQISLSFTIAT